jgi:WD40 repeat protein
MEQEFLGKCFILIPDLKFQRRAHLIARAERENAMKHRKWYLQIIVFMLSSLLLNACSFSVEVLSTPTSPPPTATSLPPTFTAVPFTLVAPSTTPTLISIRDGTYYMLEIFMSVEAGEVLRSVAFTPDSAVLATAGGNTEDFDIRLWEVANGQSLGTLDGHTGIVWGVVFSPDGQILVSVSSDKTAKIWDWRNRTLLQSLDFPGEVVNVSFSPNGQILAVGGVDEPQNQVPNAAIWTFSVGSWKPMLKFPEYLNITAMAYLPDGRRLVGGGTSRNVQVWRTGDGTSIFTLNHSHQVLDAAISPDGSTAATATCQTVENDECTDGGVWVWDLPTGRLINRLRGFPNVVESVAFSVDGSTLIAASRDGTLRFYTTYDYQPQFEATPPGGNGIMALSPDGGLLASGGANGAVHVWKVVYHP